MNTSFFDYDFNGLQDLLQNEGLNPGSANVLFNWHYKKKRREPCFAQKLESGSGPEQIDISKKTLRFLEENLDFKSPKLDTVYQAQDRTVKFLFELEDGAKVETVLIPFHNKYSICLSSQVGCAMKCSFCFTGQQGFKRHLKCREIIGQFLEAWRWLAENRAGEERILNIVFMGQGEPLHNFDEVKKACDIFLSQHGTSIGAQKITISTSGYLPGLKRWKDEIPGVNLALSLHSPFAKLRDELIPINKAYPLEEVLAEIDKIPLAKKQFITYEYLLIAGFNDGEEDARKTGELLKGKPAYINLIPFNPIPEVEYKRPNLASVEKFKKVLDGYKIPTLIRETKGDDVMAACGQLNSAKETGLKDAGAQLS